MPGDPQRAPVDDLVARLERERLDADRRYNEALTALDRAIRREVPTLPIAPTDSGIHPAATRALIELTRQQIEERVRMEDRLIRFLQTITLLVDSKDRALGGPEIRDEIAQARAAVQEVQRKVRALEAAQQDRVAAASASAPLPTVAPHSAVIGPAAAAGTANGADAIRPALNVGESAYLGFEDRFRGARQDIRERLADYVPIFSGASDVLDIGCGRGELLELFREAGIAARGIDLNPAMTSACVERGLAAETADAVAYLDSLADESLGGVIAIQVVEHLEPRTLVRLLDAAFHKLRPGAPLVLETINAACWMAFFETYIRDLTHARPLHPDTLKYLVHAAGFSGVDIRFRAAVTDADRLPHVDPPADPALGALAAAINAHADRLNGRLFSSMDYAIVARR